MCVTLLLSLYSLSGTLFKEIISLAVNQNFGNHWGMDFRPPAFPSSYFVLALLTLKPRPDAKQKVHETLFPLTCCLWGKQNSLHPEPFIICGITDGIFTTEFKFSLLTAFKCHQAVPSTTPLISHVHLYMTSRHLVRGSSILHGSGLPIQKGITVIEKEGRTSEQLSVLTIARVMNSVLQTEFYLLSRES